MRDAALATVNALRTKASPDEVAMVERFVARTRQSGNDEQQEDAVAERRRPQLRHALEAMRQVLAAQRQALIAERDADRLDEDIMRELLEDIDIEEAVVANRRSRLSDRGRGV
jgi:CPA1 family monovalent cation:H+ antiporter